MKNIKNHERCAMVQKNDLYTSSKFEFDPDERGIRWQRGCSTDSVEKSIALFQARGYTIVEWRDDV